VCMHSFSKNLGKGIWETCGWMYDNVKVAVKNNVVPLL
jgi:hypothetical protein